MQTRPPKYQSRSPCPVEQRRKQAADLLDHEEEQAVPAIPFSGARYAKDCIPLENKCNVTVVTGGEEVLRFHFYARAYRNSTI